MQYQDFITQLKDSCGVIITGEGTLKSVLNSAGENQWREVFISYAVQGRVYGIRFFKGQPMNEDNLKLMCSEYRFSPDQIRMFVGNIMPLPR